jgi:glycosyltransferase involved in cell wall biosynthesis
MVDPTDPTLCFNKGIENPALPARVALAHDWIVALRGGERVLAAIADALPHPPVSLSTMFHNGTPISPRIDVCPTTVSALNAWPESLRRWLLPRYPAAVEELTRHLAAYHARHPIDALVSTSSVAIKALKAPAGVPHLCYCHTPARYLWSQTDAYETPGLKGRLRGAGLRLFRGRLRRWDRDTAAHVTHFLANSSHTRDLIRRVYDRDAAVLHPPVRTEYFTPDASVAREDFLLVVSALEPYKRVELAIDAARLADRPLVIIGAGSHAAALRAHARGRTGVTFLGQADDDAVRDHMRRAHAFLMPQTEDFGITAVEAQACGTPVIATRAGGALDTVLDLRTGVLVPDPDARALAEALDRLPADPAGACREHALTFSEARFRTGILHALGRVCQTD